MPKRKLKRQGLAQSTWTLWGSWTVPASSSTTASTTCVVEQERSQRSLPQSCSSPFEDSWGDMNSLISSGRHGWKRRDMQKLILPVATCSLEIQIPLYVGSWRMPCLADRFSQTDECPAPAMSRMDFFNIVHVKPQLLFGFVFQTHVRRFYDELLMED